jgi:hypothetical protein
MSESIWLHGKRRKYLESCNDHAGYDSICLYYAYDCNYMIWYDMCPVQSTYVSPICWLIRYDNCTTNNIIWKDAFQMFWKITLKVVL